MNKFVTLLASASVVSTPALASVRDAAFASAADSRAAQSSVFAGARLRLRLDGSTGQPIGRAGLAVSGMARMPGTTEIRFGDGIELVGGKTGTPQLQLAGQNIGEIGRKNNLSSGAAIAIGLGVVLLVGAAVVIASKPWECRSDGAPCD